MNQYNKTKPFKTPKYMQIVEYIKNKIEIGEWTIGSKIYSQRELANMFKVNRSTVITALEELQAEGLIEGKKGSGNIVTNNTWSLLTSTPQNWNDHVNVGFHQPSRVMVQQINEAESNSNLIQLSKGELSPELFPLLQMKQSITGLANDLKAFGYEEPKGFFPLRQSISTHLKSHGIQVSPDSILIVSGALQALDLISVGLLRPGSTVLLEKPSYLYSLHVFQSAGMFLTGLPIDNEGILTKAILAQKQKSQQSILYTIPSFHNPTGYVMSDTRRDELIRVCKEERIPIIEDDIYRDLWIDKEPPLALKAKDIHGQVLYLGSLSKTLTPGLRIGWIAGPQSVINCLADIKMQSDYGSSSLSQHIAFKWLSSGLYQEHVLSVREQLKVRRDAMVEWLEKYLQDIATWEVPQGGLFIWIHIKKIVSTRSLYSMALAKGILINPGHIYGQNEGQYIRLSYAYASLTDIKEGICELSKIIRKL
ncbi:PLP-dependent aminotransferase family protein [Bacillus clarus]|uniref:Bacterial regulatory s, gntR family protein n=1 Tax=Bacillus clarus TaxID=2338372 RepID=A0A090YAQ9_9BACI|nr:PLP-dependent aminotransferase family protein [Bacillus clarus]KFM95539.1 bacterial regulatory s, gntR family protein [Bacillus clarus]RFT62873.1 PLP-dependent aminotransferase family protein [Bacillus clarus]